MFNVTRVRRLAKLIEEVELVGDDGFVYGWVTEGELHTKKWEDLSAPNDSAHCPRRGHRIYRHLRRALAVAHWYKGR